MLRNNGDKIQFGLAVLFLLLRNLIFPLPLILTHPLKVLSMKCVLNVWYILQYVSFLFVIIQMNTFGVSNGVIYETERPHEATIYLFYGGDTNGKHVLKMLRQKHNRS